MAQTKQKILENFHQSLRQQGLNVTKERDRILMAVLVKKGHYDADTLFMDLKGAGSKVARSTVYRTLDILNESGVVHKSSFGSNQFFYERMVDRDHHDHLVCTECNGIFEFVNEEIERLQKQVCETHGFVMKHHSLQLFGICQDCQQKN